MDSEAAKNAKDCLELVYQMSNMLNTELDRHTISLLIALSELGFNPESLAALVKELTATKPSSSSSTISSSSV